MPYISQTKRQELDPHIDALLNAIRGLESDDPDHNDTEGNVNYVVTRLLKRIYPGNRYAEINSAMGVLNSVTSEYYRKVAVPLENQKEYDNGEVL